MCNCIAFASFLSFHRTEIESDVIVSNLILLNGSMEGVFVMHRVFSGFFHYLAQINCLPFISLQHRFSYITMRNKPNRKTTLEKEKQIQWKTEKNNLNKKKIFENVYWSHTAAAVTYILSTTAQLQLYNNSYTHTHSAIENLRKQ